MEPNQQTAQPQTAPAMPITAAPPMPVQTQAAPVAALPQNPPATAQAPAQPQAPLTVSAAAPAPQPLTQPIDQIVAGVTPQPAIKVNSETNQTPQQKQTSVIPGQAQSSRAEKVPPNKRPQEAPKGKGSSKKDRNSAQNSLLISEIRDNMVIMNDGSFRAVVVCQSINFDLMSEEEQSGVEYSYQNFLNSLYFDIQISISSRRVDLSEYIEKLENIRRNQENMLLGRLTDDYLDFIFDISQQANLMRKSFLIIIPYFIGGDLDSSVSSLKNIRANLLEDTKPKQIKISAKDYAKAKEEIGNRVNVILSGMTSIGVQAGQLPTKALAELYYNFYNPDTAVNEPLGNFKNYIGNLYVKKGTGPAPTQQGVL